MAEKKLILCACGAGINTSKMAEMSIQDYLEKKKLHREYQVANCRVDTIESYRGRKNMVVVWMGAVDEKFPAPGVLGLPYMIASKKDKEALTEKIIELMEANYTP